jgi:hypothetical protein
LYALPGLFASGWCSDVCFNVRIQKYIW